MATETLFDFSEQPAEAKPKPSPKKEMRNRIAALKETGEDFEWYPTTDEIIRLVADDIYRVTTYHDQPESILDIGAGDGRVLCRIREQLNADNRKISIYLEAFAIEKAKPHLQSMPKDVTVIGTDFNSQTLVDKGMGVVFCNPPYSEYEHWAKRIIGECNAQLIYLVIPVRWRKSGLIKESLASRNIEFEGADGEDEEGTYCYLPAAVKSLGEFDFLNADRKARARVEVVRIHLKHDNRSAFDKAIEDMLPELETFNVRLEEGQKSEDLEAVIDGAMIEGRSPITALVESYDKELALMFDTYRQVAKIDPTLLKELGVSKDDILGGLKIRMAGLKERYWKKLFDNLEAITNRLATKQRNRFLDSLTSKCVVDFTEGNIYAMLIWITKWASDYYDEQLIDLFQQMSQKATVEKYKSNQKVFAEKQWRYLNEEASHYKLCYRMVLETHGGINESQWEWERNRFNGLCEHTYHLLSDFITVANNLGFDCDRKPHEWRWRSNKKVTFPLKDGEPLMDVRAFKNGNLHIRVAKPVMLAINVQAGKLLGWLRSADEAIRELQVEKEDEQHVRDAYEISLRIEPSSIVQRIGQK